MSSAAGSRRLGGPRPAPIPTRAPPPPSIAIPDGNVPGMHVDSSNEGGWQMPNQSLPALALQPRRIAPSSASSSRPKPKLTLSSVPSPAPSPALFPSTAPAATRPVLLNTPSPARSSTPLLKLNIPSSSAGGSGSGSGLPSEDDGDLKTPLASHAEDRNPTVQARGQDYDGGESSYGYGLHGNGLGDASTGDSMSAMTEDIRQTISRFGGSPNPSSTYLPLSRSRANSNASRSGSSRRGSSITHDDILAIQGLSIAASDSDENRAGDSRRDSLSGTDDGVGLFNPDELIHIRRLGEGTGGAVELVQDPHTQKIMAKKVIARTANPSMHKQLLRELKILNDCQSPFIVEHYGSFLAEHDSQIGILMEYCEGGSLDSLVGRMKRKNMRCTEPVLGRIAASVLKGLDYLHSLRIIHRDIKPSNILLTRLGVVKLCDFGVSGELDINSIAGTFTGTSYYMAPERIQGNRYTIKADVWSLGLTLHEVAHLRFPFPPEGESQSVAPIELLSYIVTAPVPVMIDDPGVGRVWSDCIKDFMAQCLIRSGTERPYPWQLLQHPFITCNDSKKINMAKWVATLCDWPPE
ncbi:kinase-like domain-containing protein [Naematelia encephala]|uniref:Kinase-like domain-containing protein n=1 Tax=Naematelia encephala TaxID=71784 RepID=A0A1Y2BJF9_9TREE|nr:kinase-like domain-containing protein [Naematelia encephala]